MQFHKELTQCFLTPIAERIKMKRSKAVLGMAFLLCLTMTSWAAVPHVINYQGLLKNTAGNPVPNASYSIAFTIYDAATGGANLWTETQSVTTASGLFAVQLGIGPIPLVDSIFNDTTRWLGIQVAADPEMTPRQRLSSVGYSYNSSEWTSSGPDLFRLSGKVGIGAYPGDPGTKLEVRTSVSEPSFVVSSVRGSAFNAAGTETIGVSAYGNNSSTGIAYGVYGSGFANSGTAYGGYFTGSSLGGGSYGLKATGGSVGGSFSGTNGGSTGVAGTGGTVGVSGSGDIYGVQGLSSSGIGVDGLAGTYGGRFYGTALGSYGVLAQGVGFGVYGLSSGTAAVFGDIGGNLGTWGGYFQGDVKVERTLVATGGVYASSTGPGVQAFGGTNGVEATGTSRGVYASGGTVGVLGVATSNVFPSYGIYGSNGGNFGSTYAGYFVGPVYISYDLEVDGIIWKDGGGFKIDHPTDPANKYLYHSFVESPDMKNIYDGVVTLDTKGEAIVTLPDWLEAENKDFRYQLTAIGAPGPNLYIAEEISSNQLKIAGGAAGMKVSWQVTGIRQDAWANAHRFPVEEEKSARERGKYKNPKEHGVSETLGIHYEERQKADAEQKKMEVDHKQQEEQQLKMEAESKLQGEQRAKMEAERKLQEEQRVNVEPKH